MLAGPILSVLCSKEVEFQEPVTVQLPLSLRDTDQAAELLGIPDLSFVRARVLLQSSDGTEREWTEITDDSPPWLEGTLIKFSVKHFSRYAKVTIRFQIVRCFMSALRLYWSNI